MKPTHPRTPILTLLALLLAACASSATNTTASGIEGQVLIGPMCPVMQEGVPCPDQPYQATIAVLDENRKKVTDFQSDAQGNFKIGLKPGTYILVPESTNAMTRAGEQTVTVGEGQFIRVTITYDSGIR
jgi:major membrane immunogen (membrane-anchored lipoprotein)